MLPSANSGASSYILHLQRFSKYWNLVWQHQRLSVLQMAISGRWYTGLAPTLLTIRNRCCLLVSCKAGWCPRYIFFCNDSACYWQLFVRCTAPSSDLDSDKHGRRSKAHTEMLVEEFKLGMLWDEYGLVSDIVVHLFFSSSCTMSLLHISIASTIGLPSVYSRWPIWALCTAPHCRTLLVA